MCDTILIFMSSEKLSLKSATTKTELRNAIIDRFAKRLYVPHQEGATASGTPENPLYVYRCNLPASERSNGKQVYTCNTNCIAMSKKSYAQLVNDNVLALASTMSVEEMREAYYQLENSQSYQANIWSDNPHLASLLGGAPIQGKIKLDEWEDKESGAPRSRYVIESVKDLTVRTIAETVNDTAEELEALFTMVDDTIAKPKSAPAKTVKKATTRA